VPFESSETPPEDRTARNDDRLIGWVHQQAVCGFVESGFDAKVVHPLSAQPRQPLSVGADPKRSTSIDVQCDDARVGEGLLCVCNGVNQCALVVARESPIRSYPDVPVRGHGDLCYEIARQSIGLFDGCNRLIVLERNKSASRSDPNSSGGPDRDG
jgi:hypothetical protein